MWRTSSTTPSAPAPPPLSSPAFNYPGDILSGCSLLKTEFITALVCHDQVATNDLRGRKGRDPDLVLYNPKHSPEYLNWPIITKLFLPIQTEILSYSVQIRRRRRGICLVPFSLPSRVVQHFLCSTNVSHAAPPLTVKYDEIPIHCTGEFNSQGT